MVFYYFCGSNCILVFVKVVCYLYFVFVCLFGWCIMYVVIFGIMDLGMKILVCYFVD